jgi:hypothetical protein
MADDQRKPTPEEWERIAAEQRATFVRTERMLYGSFSPPHPIGYTTAQGRVKWFKAKLAQHRKNKRQWTGTKQEYDAEEARLIKRVKHYKALLETPAYAAKVREARNRKRRVKRPPLPSRKVKVMKTVLWGIGYSPEGIEVQDEHVAHLPWMVHRVKKKRFKTVRHLAYTYRKPLKWILEARDKAIERGLISAEEWRQSFRQRGRPRKGKLRGPYKTKKNTTTENFA